MILYAATLLVYGWAGAATQEATGAKRKPPGATKCEEPTDEPKSGLKSRVLRD